ncbi:MAG: hypothetical protein J6X91_09050 [Bacteroidales bacterium]|nr:hypothetical protein [Bacteroidales bacterium]
MGKSLVDEIKSRFPNYKELAKCDFNRCHDLWERPMYQENPFFRRVKSIYGTRGNRVTTRQQIIDLFAEKRYFYGYLCALVWGNIGTFNRGREHFNNAFSITPQKLRSIVLRLEQKLLNGEIGQAFDSMCNGGENRIDGLGVSFFTKILYFLGASIKCNIRPLIFDTKSVQILNRLYRDTNTKGKARQSRKHYVEFCSRMSILSKELGLPTAGHLEAFLFNSGNSLIPKQ